MDVEFCHGFLCIYWDNHMAFIFQFVNVVNYVDWFEDIEESLHPSEFGLQMWLWLCRTFLLFLALKQLFLRFPGAGWGCSISSSPLAWEYSSLGPELSVGKCVLADSCLKWVLPFTLWGCWNESLFTWIDKDSQGDSLTTLLLSLGSLLFFHALLTYLVFRKMFSFESCLSSIVNSRIIWVIESAVCLGRKVCWLALR